MGHSNVVNDCELSIAEPITAKALVFRQVASTSPWNVVIKIAGTILGLLPQFVLAQFYGAELISTFIICSNIALVLGLVWLFGLNNGMLHFAAFLNKIGPTNNVLRLVQWVAVILMLFPALLA